MNIRSFTVIAAATLCASMLPGCQTVQTTQPGAVGVDRTQRFVVSEKEINQASEKAYAQVMQEAQKKGALNRNPAQVERVRRIANRLIPAAGAFRKDALGWKWEANVISSNEVNAWAMPGGKMAVYTGIIEKLNLTDDELAAIMGHEIAHALREHGRERASQQVVQSTVVSVGAAILGVGDLGVQLTQAVLDVTLNLPHSRTDEIEADRIGVELAARGGFDPRAAVSLWEKMGKAGGARGPEFLSTHPSPENRLADLRAYSEKVMPLYQAQRR
ncbi:MAG: peptidase M48 [Betaproteobacteria bacterium RIFCSPLOWO2_12_FULL_66_14]|nr:MAG: peptidase M48 [Betaproteobacteria bacterium RIFCSPLOWO2_12_FULL_66_14]